MFGMYDHLKVVSLPLRSFLFLSPQELDFFAPIAAKCRELQCLIARRPPYTELKYTKHTLVRDAQGVLLRVDVRTMHDLSAELDAFHMPSHIFYH